MKQLSFAALLAGFLLLFLIRVDITTDNNSISLFSHIEQTAKFHLKTEADVLVCNGKIITLAKKVNTDYFYHGDRAVFIPLIRGETLCKVPLPMGKPEIGQTISYTAFFILFVLLAIPVIYLLFFPFIQLIDRSKLLWASSGEGASSVVPCRDAGDALFITKFIAFIVLAGFLVRIAYFQKFGILTFQHDWQGHIDFIIYISQNWILPIPSQGWEYPQQPLYYALSGVLYSLFLQMGLSSSEAIINIGYASLVYSFLFLIYSYRFISLLTSSRWVQATAMAFLALTPSIVYLSARINNDSLVIMLSAMSLFYIVKSYQSGFKQGFVIALISVSLLFLTKVSAAAIELLFFALLIIVYYRSIDSVERNNSRQRLIIFSLLGLFLLGFTLLRSYMPLESSFHLVNSSGHFGGQALEVPYADYFSSFNIKELIAAGQSYIYGVDNIRHSFITYQYGTLFFGEFDYIDFVIKNSVVTVVMQLIYSLGLIFIPAFIAYGFYLYRVPVLQKMLFMVVVINFVLILRFLFVYPSICNTDFRYFVSSFPIIAFLLAQGMENLFYYKQIKVFISGIVGLLFVTELVFFYFLIYA